MFWPLFAFLAGGADIAYNYVSRTSLKNGGDASAYAWWFSFIRTVFFLLIILITQVSMKFDLRQLGILLTLGLTNFFNLYLFMKMHALTELSLSQIVLRLRMVWVPILAFFLIHERLSFVENLGILLVFLATVIITTPQKIVKDESLLTTFIFSITTSLVTMIVREASLFTQTPVVVFAMSVPTVILMPLVIKSPKARIFLKWNKEVPQKVFISALSVILLYALILALKSGPAGKVNAVFQGVSVFSVFFGVTVLKEKENLVKKIAGSILILVGIFLLI